MKHHSRLCSALLVLICANPVLAANDSLSAIRLGYNSNPDGMESGISGSRTHVECILSRLESPFVLQSVPWRRARQEVLKGTMDGYFTALPMREVERYADLSEPLVLENWYWFWRSRTSPPDSLLDSDWRLGAILGSHQSTLLESQGYPIHTQVNTLPQLIKLLMTGRIDGLLADKEQFEQVADTLAVGADQYQYRFYRYVPLGVYFGRQFLAREAGFLERFNRNIYECAPEGFFLSDYEREQIEARVMPLLAQWRVSPHVQSAVVEQNKRHKSITQDDILRWDAHWIDEFQNGQIHFARTVLDNRLSQQLRLLKHQTGGLITEIIVTDEHGLNVGISDLTSDYWQGDEDKHTKVVGQPPEHVLVGAVVYDESTRRFQVQVSMPLYTADTQQAIGVITVGVDVEMALVQVE